MNLRGGIICPEAPKLEPDRCFICTGPKPCGPSCAHDHVGQAFISGMVEGILALTVTRAQLPTGRVPLCVEHETMLRVSLARFAQGHPEVFDKLGIRYHVTREGEHVERVR